MIRRPALVLAATAILAGGVARAEDLDSLLAKNFEARGGRERLEAIEAVRFTGTMSMGSGLTAPFVLEWKRPRHIRLEFTVQGLNGVQAFDGHTAWWILPFVGRTVPEKLTGSDRRSIEEMADLFPLLDPDAKGTRLEYVGEDDADGTPAFKIKMTGSHGDISYILLDATSFLQIRTTSTRQIGDRTVRIEGIMSDYRDIDGVLVAHSVHQSAGKSEQTIHIETVDLAASIPDRRFSMPREEGATPSR
ncbi:MAG: hypothetical protein ACE5IK_06135 [Acidobacteriota bacterium]